MNIVVNSLLVNYERQGTGRSIVLLHGWGDSLKTFDVLASALAGSYDVVRLDLPGFGGTQAPDIAWRLEDYAGFVAAFIQKLGIKDIYALCGHSNGGAIAIKGLANGGIVADRLVLIASAGIRNTASRRNIAWKIVAKAGKAATVAFPVSTQQKLRSKLYGRLGSDALVVPHMQETFKNIVSEDIQSEALTLEVPTLILGGAEDTATPPRFAELFHKAIAGSRLKMVEGAGHFVHQESAELVNGEIQDFLR